MTRRKRNLATVTAASLFSRLSVLSVLAVAAAQLSSSAFHVLAYALAVSTAMQILLDPGTSSYLVATLREVHIMRRDEWWAGVKLQTFAAVGVAGGTTAVVARSSSMGDLSGFVVPLAVLAAAEGLARYARVVWQAEERFIRYAAVDLVIGVGRSVTAVTLAFLGTRGFEPACVGVAVAILVIPVTAGRSVTRDRNSPKIRVTAILRRVWRYGASTAVAASYSQLPPIVLAMRGSLAEAAAYSVASRLTQPTELLPASIAAVFLPRLARTEGAAQGREFRASAAAASAAALLISALTIGVAPILMRAFHEPGHTAVLVLLALVLPAKFVNYQFVNLAIAQGRIGWRLLLSAGVGALSIAATVALARWGAAAIAVAVMGAELALLTSLFCLTRVPTDAPKATEPAFR